MEVEAYRHHLERVYQLCHVCDVVVRRELSRQDALIRAKMHSAGLLRSESTVNADISRLSETDFNVRCEIFTRLLNVCFLALTLSSPVVSNVTLQSVQGHTGLTDFYFFDVRVLWCSGLSARVPKCQKIRKGGLDH